MQGSLEVSTCPSLIPSTPWLTWPLVSRQGLREGGGGCSLGPGRRRQEALCFCNAPETPVLPPACLRPPSHPASLCEALFILQPWQPDPDCSQRGARQPLPAPAWSWKPQRLPAKHNYPAVDTVVDFWEGREGQEGRREAAKAFNASLANLQLALAILHPIPAPRLPPQLPGRGLGFQSLGHLGHTPQAAPAQPMFIRAPQNPCSPMLPYTIHSRTRLSGAPSHPVFECPPITLPRKVMMPQGPW